MQNSMSIPRDHSAVDKNKHFYIHYKIYRKKKTCPCHHSMECPQVADGGAASSYGE
jgi:hypothetical protein